MQRFLVLLCLPLLVAARGQEHQRYDDCVSLVRQNAAAAFSEGLAWLDQGGGVAARHCTALALSAMGKDEAAADMFLEAADTAAGGQGVTLPGLTMTPQLLSSLYAQAGNSYILANLPERAIAPLGNALDQLLIGSPEAADLNIDRARALALTGDLEAAFTDLTVAIGIKPRDTDALLYRASAARQTQRYDIAKTDLENLIALRPDLAQAWLERGQLALAMEKPELARQSFVRVLELEENGAVADAARYLLEDLSISGSAN
jgi:tetratricopeptide (TPR) repeat protein